MERILLTEGYRGCNSRGDDLNLGAVQRDYEVVLDVKSVTPGGTLAVEVVTSSGVIKFRPTTGPTFESIRVPNLTWFVTAWWRTFHVSPGAHERSDHVLSFFGVFLRTPKGLSNA
ncbi:MAG TPA: hypothetical protein VK550_17350 [Polyangiaceae bacterium]|nr:hypothetical protein [Polyangiaceae bacterium]